MASCVFPILADSKTEPNCPLCGGQRYTVHVLPRLAWCASCGHWWSFLGVCQGFDQKWVGRVPPTDVRAKELSAIADAVYEEAKAAGKSRDEMLAAMTEVIKAAMTPDELAQWLV